MQEDNNTEYFESIIKIFLKNFICTSQIFCLAATQGILGSWKPNLKVYFGGLIL
jgi:hypothetical protein